MPRRRPTPTFHRLSLFDHYGWACRLVKRVREGKTVEAVVASARTYMEDVRDVECVSEAERLVGRSAALLSKNCPVPIAAIKPWKEAAKEFGTGEDASDRKLANFLARVLKDLSVAQLAEAVGAATAQADKAKARGDKTKASHWRRVATNLKAIGESIV